MLLLSISIWVIVVYSLKVAATGNPAYGLVKAAPAGMLEEAADCISGESFPEDDTIYLFVRRFFRLTAIGCLLFLVEIGVTLYFIYTDPKLLISWFIMFKNLSMLALGYSVHKNSDGNIFESVQEIPEWAMKLERVSYLVTAAGFLFLFMLVNKLIV